MAPFDDFSPYAPRLFTLAHAIAAVEVDVSLPVTRRRDLTSAVRRFATLLGLDPSQAPAGVVVHRQRIRHFVPAAHGISPKAWSNILSGAKAAFALIRVDDKFHKKPLSPLW